MSCAVPLAVETTAGKISVADPRFGQRIRHWEQGRLRYNYPTQHDDFASSYFCVKVLSIWVLISTRHIMQIYIIVYAYVTKCFSEGINVYD